MLDLEDASRASRGCVREPDNYEHHIDGAVMAFSRPLS